MQTVRLPWVVYNFKHYRKVAFADTTHIGGPQGLHETFVICEARYPYSHCPCGEYEVHWWL